MERLIAIDWETDGADSNELKLPKTLGVPVDIEDEDVADWLSDEYGWLVQGWIVVDGASESAIQT